MSLQNSFVLLTTVLLVSCAQRKEKPESTKFELEPALIALTVKDLEITTEWYVNNLGFEMDTVMNFPSYGLKINMLKLNRFRLEVIGFEDALVIDRSLLPSEYSNVNGFIKLGFITDRLDSVVSQMEKAGADFVAGPAELPELESGVEWPDRFYLVKDPDGNYVQLFEGEALGVEYEFSGNFSLAPFLAMISVQNFQETIEWYQQRGFEYIEGLEAPGNQRGLLSSGQFVIELGAFDSDTSLDVLGIPDDKRDRVVRMSKLGFKSAKVDSLYSQLVDSNYPLFYADMEGDEPNFIVNDNEGNFLQFFKE